jgi:phosphatidylserine/phosphatidylglycerophosphate/cardiolipin synthase-like enzyme
MNRTELVSALDRRVGAAVEEVMVRHHRRRLCRRGWLGALDAPAGGWAAGEPPQRPGNQVEVLVDGAMAIPRLVQALERAESHVHLAGWHFSPEFAVRRDGEPLVLRDLLAELGERVEVRVLAWAGAPVPMFRPSRREMRSIREALTGRTRVQCALDARERPLPLRRQFPPGARRARLA